MIFKTALQHAMVNSDALSTEFCEILGLSKIFGNLAKCGGSIFPGNPAFVGNVPIDGVMTGVETGVGLLAEARVYQIESPDANRVYNSFAGGEPAYEGGAVSGEVGSRVVTVTDPDNQPRLLHCPQMTNHMPESRDLTAANWLPTGGVTITHDQIGIDGKANAASYLADMSDASIQYVRHGYGVSAGVSHCIVFWLHKSGTGIFGLQVSVPTSVIQIDVSTGNWVWEIQGSFLRAEVLDDNEWWKVVIEHSGSGGFTGYFFPARALALGDAASAAATGFNIIDAICVWEDTSLEEAIDLPPIYCDAAATVTRDACDLSFDAANQDDAQGTWLVEADATGVANILDGFLTHSGNSIILSDGVNSQSLSADTTSHKIGVVYGSGTMKLNIDGVWHADGPYDGTLLQGALDLFRNSGVVGYFGALARYNEKDETIVDAWMAA